MDVYGGLLGLIKAASLLRGDARTAYLINDMQDQRGENKIREQIYGAPKTKERDGTTINWNGPRALPSGQISGMLEQQGPTRPGEGALPAIPASVFSPELRAEGIAERKQQLMALPAYQKLAEAQMFAAPKPPKFMEASGGIAKINEDTGTADWALKPPEKTAEGTELSKYQTELDAMPPNDPRRPTWAAKIKRLAEGEPKEAKVNEPPSGYRFTPEGNLAAIPGGPADRPGITPPAGYRFTADEKALEPIPGGPADIGQKGLPQAYKDATAGLNTLESSVLKFRDTFSGTKEVRDPVTGQVIKPATSGTGTEMFETEGAGDLDTAYATILFGVKNAEQTGALDKGSVDVIQGMLKKPTGLGSAFTRNSYIEKQVEGVLDYINRRRKDLSDAYSAGTFRPPGSEQTAGGDPAASGRQYVGFTPDGKRVYVENGQQYAED